MIVNSKIGSIDPESYQFAEIYKQIFTILKKCEDMSKELREIQNDKAELENLEYK